MVVELKAADEPAGTRISLHCQAVAVCGFVSNWRVAPTGAGGLVNRGHIGN